MPDTVIPTSLTRNRLALTQYSSPHRRPSSSYNGPKLGVRTRRPPSIPVSKPPPIKQCHCQDLTLRKPDTALKLVVAIVALSDVGATVSHAAETEPKGTIYRVGFLWGLPPIAEWTAALDEGLAELGWVSGRNIVVENRSAEGHYDRLPHSLPNWSGFGSM